MIAKTPLQLLFIMLLSGLGVRAGALAQTSAGQIVQEVQQLDSSTTVLLAATIEFSSLQVKPAAPKPGQVSFIVQSFFLKGNQFVAYKAPEGLVGEHDSKKADQEPGFVSQLRRVNETPVPQASQYQQKWTMPIRAWKGV